MKYLCEYYDPESGEIFVTDHFTEEILERANLKSKKKGRKLKWRFALNNQGKRTPIDDP